MNDSKKEINPRGSWRILFVSDPSSIVTNWFPDPAGAEDLRRWVDIVADSDVDVFNQEVYSQGWTAYWRSERFEYDRRKQHRRFLPMLERGEQPLDVLIDQSHRRGMTFVAGFRINDNHAFQAKQQGVGIASAIESHPEWALKDFPPGEFYKTSEPLDFTFDGAREFVLSVIAEVVERFDIEGVEMCFRDHAYFPYRTGRERAPLMTDFVRQVRDLLDERSKKRGERMVLGARMFSTLAECLNLGLDVKTWIEEDLLDYLSPQDTMYADFNLPYEEFSVLTRASKCMLYPGMLPWTSIRARNRLNQIPLSPANCRALARTMYATGADGISVYNHFCAMWNAPFYPQMMAGFRELRDVERISRSERAYVFDPTWSGFDGFGQDRTSTGEIKANRVVLDRSKAGAAGEYGFNLYEDLRSAHMASLVFRGFGLTEEDRLELTLNGHPIPADAVWQTRESDAPPADWHHVREEGGKLLRCIPEQGRIDFRKEKEPAFSTRWFSLNASLVEIGRNRLEFKLAYSDPGATSPSITIDEVEVYVTPK